MNIVVLGGGAVGSVIATELARAGEEVTLLVRAQAMPATGTLKITVEDADHETRWAIVPVISTITETPDLVILCVKAPDLESATAMLVEHIGDTPVVALHAAPQGDAIVSRTLGRASSSGVFLGRAEYVQPGHVRVSQPQIALAATLPGAAASVAAFTRAITAVHTADLPALRWALVLANLPQAIAALVNQPLSTLTEDRTTQALATTLLIEASRVFAKAGIVPANLPPLDIAKLCRLHSMPGFFASRVVHQEPAFFQWRGPLIDPLLQSLRRQRPTEIDALHGEIVRLGQQHGVPTPTTAQLVEVMHGIERSGTFLTVATLKHAMRV